MFFFLFPLVFGFACNLASAFTTRFSRQWGKRRGSFLTALLRNILGIPVWAAGFVLAVQAPSPRLFAPTWTTQVVGRLMIAIGGLVIIIALVTIRLRAAISSVDDTLVRSGIYAHVRHPIHTGTFLEFAGLLILMPTPTVALACALGCGWLLAQTRCEEHDLLQRLPEYREYMNEVPRFLPRRRTK